jgi:hypothetical protein
MPTGAVVLNRDSQEETLPIRSHTVWAQVPELFTVDKHCREYILD